MCSSNVIVYVAYGKINGPVFIVACSDRYSSLIAAENDRAKNRAMGFWILGNDILMNNEQMLRMRDVPRTHCLTPGPVPGHEVLEAMGTILSALLEGCVIEIGFEIWVGEEIVHKGTWVPKTDVILGLHP
jgi:hypothetical protein